jgi:peptide/nickel transport system substrate-binding protein
MKRGIIWGVLTCLMVTSLVLASCSKSTTTSTSASTTIPTTKTTTTTTTATATTTTTITNTTATTGNWWDSLGKPQYGGTMTIRVNADITDFDPWAPATMCIFAGWMERLFADNWTLDPAVFNYSITWRPPDYVVGGLAKSWEFSDPGTIVFHLRQGVHWQNIAPANGRELTADDIIFHFDREYGLGGGYTTASPYVTFGPNFKDLISLTSPDKYTVVFKWKTPNPEIIMETMTSGGFETFMESPDEIKQYGNANDWHHAIGTGPFILQDLVAGASATLVRNPNYWGYDERYLQNQLPYIDTLRVLIIPDTATALSAMRTGKIDIIDQMSLSVAQNMKNSNPEILQLSAPFRSNWSITPKNSVKPFNDIRVRKAMQLAIDLPTIAATYYGGTSLPYPSSLTSIYEAGWGFPYTEWPQDLKDQYAYNPTAAKQLLADAGYPNGFNTNCVADNSADLDLLQIIKSYWAAVGINMTITTMDPSSWNTFVRVQMKYDQLAFRSNGSLGFTYEPTAQLSTFKTGYSGNWYGVSDPVYDVFPANYAAATSIDVMKTIVKDANEYVARQHFLISTLQPPTFALCQPWVKGFNNPALAFLGTGTGPAYLGFYSARYWIDSNLKKSLGH